MVKSMKVDQQAWTLKVTARPLQEHKQDLEGNMNVHYSLDDAREAGQAPWDDVVREDFHVMIFKDKYPVTEGHMLFVPKYSANGVIEDCFADALRIGQEKVKTGEWDGFNIGINWGEAAGQTVPYPHVHLIPRRKGDMEDPTGGVRHVIPERGNYRKW
jgi:diadenosine tetraphosphate (Ap4A) HIT family hydrolase